jgi:HK97 family phage prohead protease
MDRRDLLTKIEHRLYTLTGVEVRDADAGGEGGSLQLVGYASVFDVGYDMWGGPPWPGWTEYVKPGAFKRTLANGADVQLLLNHTGLPLARTKSETLSLSEDATGLAVDARLEPTDPDVLRMVPKMKRGDLDEMSFAFRIIEDQWFNEDGEERDASDTDAVVRHLLEVSIHKGDVSVVNYGANDSTSTELLAFDRALVELRAGRTLDDETRAAVATRLGLAPETPEISLPAPEVETLSLATALALASRDRDAPAA